jgi:hypothetical protein
MVPMPSQNENMPSAARQMPTTQQALFQPSPGYASPYIYGQTGLYPQQVPIVAQHQVFPIGGPNVGNQNGYVSQIPAAPNNAQLVTQPQRSEVPSGSPSRTIEGPPAHMTLEMQFEIPQPPGRGRGRGKKSPEYVPPMPPVLGKGRAATQGVVVPIEHKGRQQALAEQARKRKRFEEEESEDDTERRELEQVIAKTLGEPITEQKRAKPETKGKRDHFACDRCFRNKTKVRFSRF